MAGMHTDNPISRAGLVDQPHRHSGRETFEIEGSRANPGRGHPRDTVLGRASCVADYDDYDDELFDDSYSAEQVLKNEKNMLQKQRRHRVRDGAAGVSFSLAFSGGGVRAAAFQAGVLWKLAKMNRLKDVEYLVAVSGGGYVASSFCSHCLGVDPPREGEVRAWYLERVAETITRMQANAGDFVRDCVKQPGVPKDGSGHLPRILDAPVLLLVLGFTICLNPVYFILVLAVPTSVLAEMYFAPGMRAAYCARTWEEAVDLYLDFSYARQFAVLTGCLIIAGFINFIARVCPFCRRRAEEETSNVGFYLNHAVKGLLTRITGVVVILNILFAGMWISHRLVFQLGHWFHEYDLVACHHFIEHMRDVQQHGGMCANSHFGRFWYDDPRIVDAYANASWEILETEHVGGDPFIEQPTDSDQEVENFSIIRKTASKVLWASFLVFVLALMFSMCIAPIMGPELLQRTLVFAGPGMALVSFMVFVQIGIYGPITKNRVGRINYNHEAWQRFLAWALASWVILLPFYEEFRTAMHSYYKRCLRMNFFRNGQDVQFSDLVTSAYCPYLVLTGTSSDYQRRGVSDKIHEMFFSALHVGGQSLGYLRQPRFRSLAKCAALSGAGCLDAISLTMSENLYLRFWLEVLNLSWGDYVVFKRSRSRRFEEIAKRAGPWGEVVYRLLNRGIAIVPMAVLVVLINAGWRMARSSANNCMTINVMYGSLLAVVLVTYGLSFFSFLRVAESLSLSPMLRTFHQATGYCLVGDNPPPMLYVTDGGVKDCTGLLQLLWRQTERILMVLAAADPNDELGVLKTAMAQAAKQRLATFFDPKDPRMAVERLFEEFKHDKCMPYLHLGITYYSTSPEGRGVKKVGRLIIVKNRLPPSLEDELVMPLLTPEEIRNGPWEPESRIDKRRVDELGPLGCCDCCHDVGCNCGAKFPHGNFCGYLVLTPTWYNCLARLGFAVSEEAIDKVATS